jgi:hypothetical protein
MIKNLYNLIKARIEATLPDDIKQVDWWAFQPEKTDMKSPVKYPAAFIDFPSITFQDALGGVQEASITVAVRVVTWDYRKEKTHPLDLAESVNDKLNGWIPGNGFDSLVRRAYETDPEHDSIYSFRITYELTGYEEMPDDRIEVTDVLLAATTSWDMDNDIVRTGDGLD